MSTDTLTTAGGHQVTLATGDAAVESATTADGFNAFGANPRGRANPALMAEASRLIGKALKGSRRAALEVQEAFSTSDFTLAAFALIDQEVVARYQEIPSAWRAYTRITTVRDFKPKNLRSMWRNRFGLDRVPELTEYPLVDGKGAEITPISVGKYGDRFSLSWEAWVNDEAIDEIGDIPEWLAQAAAETDATVAASNLVNASGVNTAFFKTANGNAPTALPLTLENLDAAIEEVRTRKVKGRVVQPPALKLVVGPSSQTRAERILAIREIRTTTDGVETVSANYLAGSVSLVVDPALEHVNTSAKAAGTWFLLPDPDGPRPALYLGRLRGHENPDLRVKSDTGNRVGGGAIPAEEGSFDIDDIQYRVRHVVGGAAVDPTFTYASTGS